MKTATRKPLPHEEIRASAGTGKTYQLTSRYLRLVYDGIPTDQILATTFTRKAAGEILGRVLLELARAVGNTKRRAELAERVGADKLSDADCQTMLQQLVGDLHRLRIGTLDSFFAQIARSLSLELGLPPGWTIVDEVDDAALRDEAIEQLLSADATDDVVRVMHLLTKGETSRSVAGLVRDTVRNLYDVFQQSSADAWRKVLRPKAPEAALVTAALDQLRTFPAPEHQLFRKALAADLELASAGDWESFLAKGIANKVLGGEETYQRVPLAADLTSAYRTLIDQARAQILASVAARTEGTHGLLARYHEFFQQLKHRDQSLRFNDVTRALAEATENYDLAHLAYRLDCRLDHLLVDEFQDTSFDQWHVLRPLAQSLFQPAKSARSFFCVGDIKQAIYGWRGGLAEIFDALKPELGEGLTSRALNKSYRSSPPVIDMVNALFSQIARHDNLDDEAAHAVKEWQQSFPPHATACTELAGYVTLETSALPAEGEKGDAAHLDYAAQRVKEIVEQAPGFEVAVIVRTNATVGEMISRLRRLGIAASEEAGNPLTDSAAVQLILSLLRLVDHPGDSIARFHLAQSPLAEFAELRGYEDVGGGLRLAARVRRDLEQRGYGEVIEQWAQRLSPSCNQREWNRLTQLTELAYTYNARATTRTSDFLALVEGQRVSDPLAAPVRVLNMHQSKGLEFDIVVLPELDEQLVGQPPPFVIDRETPAGPISCVCRYEGKETQSLMPPALQRMFAAQRQRRVRETLCTLYVAVTRAIHALHMIVSPSKKSEKSLHKTMAGLVRAALTEGQPLPERAVAYKHGDAQWYLHPGDKRNTKVHTGFDVRSLAPPDVKLAPPLAAATRGLESVAPSRLEGGGRVRLSEAWKTETGVAMDRGTLIHAWFESITWLDETTPSDETLRNIASGCAVSPELATAAQNDFKAMLKATAVAAMLTEKTYCEGEGLRLPEDVLAPLKAGKLRPWVFNEFPIAVREGSHIVRGAVDRLVVMYAGEEVVAADIIDYKTDTLPADAAGRAAKVEFYRPQLAAYRRAIAAIWRLPLERVSTRLLFVGAGVVCPVEHEAVKEPRTK